MPADHETSERVYAALKSDLIDGRLGNGRLRIGAFDDRYQSSATPIRESLLRLVGEGMLEMPATGGFVLRGLNIARALDLYGATQLLLLAVIGHRNGRPEAMSRFVEEGGLDPPIDRLFEAIVVRTGNQVLIANMRSLNDRMRRIRRAEMRCLSGIEREFTQIELYFRRGERAAFRRAVIAYHRRRVRHLPEIMAELSRFG